MSSRSILKAYPSLQTDKSLRPKVRGGHVHFPPSPEISSTFYAYSPRAYDRSAIQVTPNDCALPRRNCPDRTYVLSEGKGEARLLKYEAEAGRPPVQEDVNEDEGEDDEDTPPAYGEYESRTDYFSIPPMPHDQPPEMTWSESDDSDGLMSPPNINEMGLSMSSSYYRNPPIPTPRFPFPQSDDFRSRKPSSSSEHALAFLPHAPQRRRSISPRDREQRDKADPQATMRRQRPARRISSFKPSVPNYDCLGGF